MTREKLVTKKESSVCPHCKAELKGAKKKCPICHRALSIAPTKKTEKERRIEMLDRQYNPDNPEYATPTPESIPEQVNTHPTSWEWDDSETEPAGTEQKLPQTKEGFEDLQKFILGGKYLFIEKGASFELIALPSKTTGPDYVFKSERKDKEIVKLSPEQLREMFAERKIFITKTIEERRKEQADQIRRSRKYLGLNLLGQSFEFKGRIGSYEDVDESAVTLMDMDNKKMKIPLEEFKSIFLSPVPAKKTPSIEIGNEKFEEFRKKINAGEEISLSFIDKNWKFLKVQGASVDGDHAVGYVLVQPDGSQLMLMEKDLIEDFKNGTISIIENSDINRASFDNMFDQMEAEEITQKTEAVAALREKIANAQKIIEETERREEEILKRLAEIVENREFIKRLKEAKRLERESKEKEMKDHETKTFSPSLMREKIKDLLSANKNIKEIKKLVVQGAGNELKLITSVIGKKGFISVDIDIKATLSNKGGNIILKNHEITASSFQGIIEETIAPHLGKISEGLKKYIETEEKKKIERLEIENGELKVTFKA
jgi:hypothetical protein